MTAEEERTPPTSLLIPGFDLLEKLAPAYYAEEQSCTAGRSTHHHRPDGAAT